MMRVVFHTSPRFAVRRLSSPSRQKTLRKPNLPSRMVAGPAKPSRASIAAITPDCVPCPRCSRFTVPPPDFANSSNPDDSEPAIPRALVICSAFKFSNRPATMAAPNGPVTPGAWNPSFSDVSRAASPIRCSTSKPETKAVINSRPETSISSATASADGSNDAPGCTPTLGDTRLSISNECANTPFASAAIGACTLSDARMRNADLIQPRDRRQDRGGAVIDVIGDADRINARNFQRFGRRKRGKESLAVERMRGVRLVETTFEIAEDEIGRLELRRDLRERSRRVRDIHQVDVAGEKNFQDHADGNPLGGFQDTAGRGRIARAPSLRLDAGRSDYLVPLLGFRGDDFAKTSRRANKHHGPELQQNAPRP